MGPGDGAGAEVEGGGAPDAVGEVASEGVVVVKKFIEVIFIIHVQFRCPCGEGGARKASYPFDALVFEKFVKLPAVYCGLRKVSGPLLVSS